jgi:hypothetical protein
MSIALAALIIALASLMWNVVSTVYSWKFAKPTVSIAARPHFSEKRMWLDINVVNTGGSAIGVKMIHVIWWFAKGEARRHTYRIVWIRRWLLRFRRRFSTDVKPKRLFRSFANPDEGPELPHTITPYHDEAWKFDYDQLRQAWLNSSPRTKKFLVEVWLSNGKRAACKVDASYLFGKPKENKSLPGSHQESELCP